MSKQAPGYIDFRSFYFSRENQDLVSATQWRRALERVRQRYAAMQKKTAEPADQSASKPKAKSSVVLRMTWQSSNEH